MRRNIGAVLTWVVVIAFAGCDSPEKLAEPIASVRDLHFVLPYEAVGIGEVSLTTATIDSFDECEFQIIKDPECEVSGGGMTDEELLRSSPPRIVNTRSAASMSAVIATGTGYTSFIGTHGWLETEMQMYYLGNIMTPLTDHDEYETTLLDILREGFGHCGAGGCEYEMNTRTQASLGRTCGNSIRVTSKTKASNILRGFLIATTGWQNSNAATASQESCPPDEEEEEDTWCEPVDEEPAPGDGGEPGPAPCDGGPGSGGGGSGVCSTYTCETWFWYDPDTDEILEIIGTWCWCSDQP